MLKNTEEAEKNEKKDWIEEPKNLTSFQDISGFEKPKIELTLNATNCHEKKDPQKSFR